MADLAGAVREAAEHVVPAPAPAPVRAPQGQQRPFRRQGNLKPASEASVAFLRKLVAERYPSASEEYVASVIAQGQKRVSVAIAKLKEMPKVEQAPAPFTPRTNRYPGTCEHCGTRVEAEAGVLTKSDEDKWEVAHKDGECPVSEYPFPVGRYAAAFDFEVHFFHATHDGLFEQAGDTLYPVHGKRVEEVVGQVALDPAVASTTYGVEIGQCGRCGRTLTDEVSRAAGIGPVCAGKSWA
jgi:hypothetical protein